MSSNDDEIAYYQSLGFDQASIQDLRKMYFAYRLQNPDGANTGATATVNELKATADTSVNNSAVYVDAPGLSQDVAVDEEWDFDGILHYDASTTGDIKMQVVVPAGCTVIGAWTGLQVAAGGDGSIRNTAITSASLAVGLGGIGVGTTAAVRVSFKVIVGATAGTVKLQFAQNTVEATNCTLHANSYLTAAKVA